MAANVHKPQRQSGAAFHTVVAAETEQEEGLSSPSLTAASHSTSHQLPGTAGLDTLTAQAMPQRRFSKWDDHKLLNTVHKGFLSPWV